MLSRRKCGLEGRGWKDEPLAVEGLDKWFITFHPVLYQPVISRPEGLDDRGKGLGDSRQICWNRIHKQDVDARN
jgi:hypothetical protein